VKPCSWAREPIVALQRSSHSGIEALGLGGFGGVSPFMGWPFLSIRSVTGRSLKYRLPFLACIGPPDDGGYQSHVLAQAGSASTKPTTIQTITRAMLQEQPMDVWLLRLASSYLDGHPPPR
jgi:hypothetical protein